MKRILQQLFCKHKKENKVRIVVKCKLTGKPCIHADIRQADTGVYENCRLCEVYEALK